MRHILLYLFLAFVLLLLLSGFFFKVVFGGAKRGYQKFRDKRQKLEHSQIELRSALSQTDLTQTDFTQTAVQSKNKLIAVLQKQGSLLTLNNEVEVLTDGKETFEVFLKALEKAEHHIHIEFYIFEDDHIGGKTLDILKRKAGQGIEVRVIVDGWGSRKLSGRFAGLKKAGVQIEYFLPLKFPYISSTLSLRNHRKLIIVDGKVGFLGGFNIGDEYLSRDKQFGYWRDTFIKLEGDALYYLQNLFLNDWAWITSKPIDDKKFLPQQASDTHRQFPDSQSGASSVAVQIAVSGPDTPWEAGLQSFLAAVKSATQCVYLETPYFVPEQRTLNALKAAASSGVEVKIVMQGIPDHRFTFWASQSYVEELLQAGVKVYLYQAGLLHTKAMIIDNELSIVGSSNFDQRSFRLNFEVNAFMYAPAVANRLTFDFENDLKHSEQLILTQFSKRPLMNKIMESTARLFAPIL